MKGWVPVAAVSLCLTGLMLLLLGGQAYLQHAPTIQPKTVLGVADDVPLTGHLGQAARAIAFSADGTEVVAHQNDGKVVAWDTGTETGRLLAQTTAAFGYCAAQHTLVISSDTNTVQLSLTDGGFTQVAAKPFELAAFSEDCGTLALAAPGLAQLRIVRSDGTAFTFPTAHPVGPGLAISSTGRFVAATVLDAGPVPTGHLKVQIFQLGTGIDTIPESAGSDGDFDAFAITFVGMEKAVVVGTRVFGQNGLRSIDSTTGQILWGHDGFGGDEVISLAASPRGTYLSTGDAEGWIRLWDIDTGTKLAESMAGAPVSAVAFAPDGRSVAAALADGTIALIPLTDLVQPAVEPDTLLLIDHQGKRLP